MEEFPVGALGQQSEETFSMKWKLKRMGLPICLMFVAASVQAAVVRIDFGKTGSPVRDGFTAVTEQSVFKAGAAAGWLDAAGLEAVDRPTRGPVYTTDLRQDSVQGRNKATLRVAAPAGKYRVWIMAGTGGGSRAQIWDMRISSGSSSTQATLYGPDTARLMRLDAVSRDGTVDLTITTRSKWALNAMVIASVEEWAQLEKTEIAKLEREVILLPDEFLKNWKHTPHVDNTPPPKYTPEEKARGFVLYRKPWVTPVWPNTVPRREEFDPKLRAFASPDEYEPLTFTVMPLRDFEQAMVKVSDLRTKDGHVIPADDIEVRYVRYMYVRPNYNVRGTYYRAPDLLPRFDEPQPLKANENFRAWLTVYVRPYAAAGNYRGVATLTLNDKQAAKLPILVRVLPIKLQKDRSLVYGTYYKDWSGNVAHAPDAFSRRWWARKIENDFKSMAAHGYSSFIMKASANINKHGRWAASLDSAEREFDMARRHGLFDGDKPVVNYFNYSVGKRFRHYTGKSMTKHIYGLTMPPQAFFDEVTKMVEAFQGERKRRGLPEILYYPIDEPNDSKVSMEFMVKVLAAIKKAPGARIYMTADPANKNFAPMEPYIDVWSIDRFVTPPEEWRADWKKRGVEVWCYPNNVSGCNDHTPVAAARMIYGFGLWRSGYRVLMPWTFESWNGDPENYLDGSMPEFMNHTADDADLLPCTIYEGHREGIDDYRYVTTLKHWIAAARELGYDDEAAQAEADLKAVWGAINLKAVKEILEVRNQYDTGWTDDGFDNYRWILAKRIIRLQKVCSR